MAAYRAEANQLDIKCHGTVPRDSFGWYITAPCVATSSVTRALAAVTTAL